MSICLFCWTRLSLKFNRLIDEFSVGKWINIYSNSNITLFFVPFTKFPSVTQLLNNISEWFVDRDRLQDVDRGFADRSPSDPVATDDKGRGGKRTPRLRSLKNRTPSKNKTIRIDSANDSRLGVRLAGFSGKLTAVRAQKPTPKPVISFFCGPLIKIVSG